MTDVIIIIGLILAMINDYILRKEVRKYEKMTKKTALLVTEVLINRRREQRD
ncbi:MAG: hypothetical protein II036_01360 [Oscillospiraceae bacterium]|nr:hypothetical protein [Oscillospiraceae bacterium]